MNTNKILFLICFFILTVEIKAQTSPIETNREKIYKSFSHYILLDGSGFSELLFTESKYNPRSYNFRLSYTPAYNIKAIKGLEFTPIVGFDFERFNRLSVMTRHNMQIVYGLGFLQDLAPHKLNSFQIGLQINLTRSFVVIKENGGVNYLDLNGTEFLLSLGKKLYIKNTALIPLIQFGFEREHPHIISVPFSNSELNIKLGLSIKL